MTPNAIDGFSFERWLGLFRGIKEEPQRFVDAMNSPILPKWHGVDAELLQHQRDLRKKVARKFASPDRWVWSNDYLQLASDQVTAEMVASHFPTDCQIIDAGCGGGSDSISLAKQRKVVALDKNEFACHLTQCNALLQQTESSKLEARQYAVEDLQPDPNAFLHLDPDRRHEGQRSVQIQWHSPDLQTVTRLIRNTAGGSIKLAPACSDDHLIFEKDIARHWISVNRSVVQQRWWWGAFPSISSSIRLSAFRPSTGWIHENIPNRYPKFDQPQIIVKIDALKPGMYIGDGDPVLRASNCQMMYISDSRCTLIGNEQGFYLSDSAIPLPLIRWHKIAAILPLDAKRIRSAIRELGFDAIDIKSRNVRSIPRDLLDFSLKRGIYRTPIFAFALGRSHLAVIGAKAALESDNSQKT